MDGVEFSSDSISKSPRPDSYFTVHWDFRHRPGRIGSIRSFLVGGGVGRREIESDDLN